MVKNINTFYWEIFCTLENSIYFCAIKRTFIETLLEKIQSKISIFYSEKILFFIFSSFNHLRIIIFNNLCTI